MNPEEVLTKEALSKPHRTTQKRRGACQSAKRNIERDDEERATQQQTPFRRVINSVPEELKYLIKD